MVGDSEPRGGLSAGQVDTEVVVRGDRTASEGGGPSQEELRALVRDVLREEKRKARRTRGDR